MAATCQGQGEFLSFVLCLGTSLYLPAVLTFSLGSPGGLVLPAAGPTGPPPTHYFLLPPGLPGCSPAGCQTSSLSMAAAQTAARLPAVPSTVIPGWVPAELTLVGGGQGCRWSPRVVSGEHSCLLVAGCGWGQGKERAMLVGWGDAHTGLVSNPATHLLSGCGEG